MKSLVKTSVIIFLLILPYQAYSKSDGILLELKSLVVTKQLSSFFKKNKLRVRKEFIKSKVLFIESSTQRKNSSYEDICHRVKRIPGVKRCVENTIMESSGDCILNKNDSRFDLELSVVKKIIKKCELFPSVEFGTYTEDNLSLLWAQEYTGADLLRERLENDPEFKHKEGTIGVWDNPYNQHGAAVANLIQGPTVSSLIPSSSSTDVTDVVRASDALTVYEEQYNDCLGSSSCPHIIASSQQWGGNELVADTVERMATEEGVVFVTSADNNYVALSRAKERVAKNKNLIVVGSVNSNGSIAEYSNFSKELTISAPSGSGILSHDGSRYVVFDGTSAAAPQVAAALGAFSSISSYELSPIEAKRLLQKSAIVLPNLPRGSNMGEGLLNTYKIGEIAYRLKNECSDNHECITDRLKQDSTYNLEDAFDSSELLTFFPQCPLGESAPQSEGDISDRVCSKSQKDLLKKLRQVAFLNNQPSLWRTLACVSRIDGKFQNASFYDALADRLKINSDDQIAQQLLKSSNPDDHSHLVKYILSGNLDVEDNKAILREMIRDKKAIGDIVKFIFRDPDFYSSFNDSKELILDVIKNSSWDKNEIYSHVLTGNYPLAEQDYFWDLHKALNARYP